MPKPPYSGLIVLMTCVASSACSGARGSDGRATLSPAVLSGIQTLRDATQSFASIEEAVKAGYASDVRDCLVHELHGAMGFHHVNAALMDADLDVRKPEILLFERMANGEYRLNGAEFILPYRHWPRDSTPPQIMGQRLNREDNLQFWYLHVWAWKPNPDGVFANFHPDVQCSAESRKVFRPSVDEDEQASATDS